MTSAIPYGCLAEAVAWYHRFDHALAGADTFVTGP